MGDQAVDLSSARREELEGLMSPGFFKIFDKKEVGSCVRAFNDSKHGLLSVAPTLRTMSGLVGLQVDDSIKFGNEIFYMKKRKRQRDFQTKEEIKLILMEYFLIGFSFAGTKKEG